VYVGDSPERDLVGARASGMRCVLFRTSPEGPDGLRADACFHHYAMLPAILRRIATAP
jgi:FMN phosphatase YigB (HAD superfamily)